MILKLDEFNKYVYTVRMLSLALKVPAGFEQAEGEQLTAIQNRFWKEEIGRGWSLGIGRTHNGIRDQFD